MNRWPGTNIDESRGLPHAYAPGHHIRAAEGDQTKWQASGYTKPSSGTSDAAASTAGLAAYLFGLGHADLAKAQKVKDYIVKNSWSRKNEDGNFLPGIFNGFNRALAPKAELWTP